MRIGITGHQDLGDAPTAAWVRAAVNQVLGEHMEPLVGVSSLAAGADQLFAELVLERRGALEVIVPFPEYRDRYAEGHQRRTYDRLISGARVEALARGGRSDEAAYLRAGQEVVARCDLLVAVWNGAPAGGIGGTGDIVQHARSCGRAMVILNPVSREASRSGEAARPMRAAELDDLRLDAARRIGDPIVDPIVSAHLEAHGPDAMGRLLEALFRTRGLPADEPFVASCLRALGEVDIGDPEIVERGQRLFGLFGPEIFLILGSCSLPLAFAAGNGVQVVYRSRRLKDDPVRRLYDTAQMVINVMQVTGLGTGQVGWRTACKVRLIHALIRRHVASGQGAPWSEAWGTPINQEDLSGTLLSFSVAVLHGLRRMGARLSAGEADAYVYTWAAIGRLLGIDEALLARTEQDASALALRIGNRQIRETPEGKLLAGHLLDAVSTLFRLPGYANSLTHFLLADTAFGVNVARALALPEPNWTRALVAARAWQKRQVLALLGWAPGARRRRSFVARRFVQAMVRRKRSGEQAPFEIPEALAAAWRVGPGRR